MNERRVGHARIPNFVVRSPELSNIGFRLLAVLLSLNPAFPSYSKIRSWTGLARASIAKAIKELVCLGIVVYRKGNSGGLSNRYRVRPIKLWKIETPCKIEGNRGNQFKNDTKRSSKSERDPVHKVNGKQHKINTTSETRFATSLFDIANKEGQITDFQQSFIAKFEAALWAALKGKKFYTEVPALVSSFVATNGGLVPLEGVRSVVFARFQDERGMEFASKLNPLIDAAYASNLAAYRAAHAPVESKKDRQKRLKQVRAEKLSRLAAEGKLETESRAKKRKYKEFKESLASPIFDGIFDDEGSAKKLLREIHGVNADHE